MTLLRALALILAFATAAQADLIPTGRYGGTPTLGACGTSPTLASNSFDSGGQITLGTGVVTSCVLNFSTGGAFWSTTPKCVVTSNASTAFAFISALSGSALTIGLSVSLPGGIVTYLCF